MITFNARFLPSLATMLLPLYNLLRIWWHGLNDDIETLSSQCEACKTTAAMPVPAAPHPWQCPSIPWEQIHIDYDNGIRPTC